MSVPRIIRWAILLILVATPTAFAQTTAKPQSAGKNHILKKWGIEVTSEGISRYLKNILPNSDAQKEVRTLVEQLSDKRFDIRRRAANKLSVSPYISQKILEEAAKSKMPELRKRAKNILKRRGSTPRLVPISVFRAIRTHRIPVAVSDLLNAIPHLRERYLRHAVRETILFVAEPDDAIVFIEALSNPQIEIRIAAVQALGKLRQTDSREKLSSLLASTKTSDLEKIHIYRTLLGFGERTRLHSLVELLESDDLQVRIYASITLTDIAGDSMGFTPFEEVEERIAGLEKWKEWGRSSAETITLNLPLPSVERGMGHLKGNTLLAFGYKNKVVEFDSAGKEIWEYKIRGAWSAEKLKNGNVLIAAYYLDKTIEVAPDGETVWEYPVRACLNARKLRNGNVLVVSSSGRKVLEIDPKKNSVVWQHKTNANCRDACRLANGNTLVAYGNILEEVTLTGTTSWMYENKTQPFGIHALANGNILIADFGVSNKRGSLVSGRVIEITRDKEIVWQYVDSRDGRLFRPSDVFRLPNGNTLVTTEKRFLEIDAEGKVLWEKLGCQYGSARR